MGYWRYVSIKQSITPSSLSQTTLDTQPIEVPKTLPAATLDDRVKSIEDTIGKIVSQVNGLKTQNPPSSASLDSRLKTLEGVTTELTARISALEKSSQPSSPSNKSTAYITLGASGSWDYSNWTTLTDYQITLDPANFPGYTSMALEVIFRVVDSNTTTSVRLYNASDNSIVSSEDATTSSNFILSSSSSFKLASGNKTYVLQAKNSGGQTFFIQLARLRVNY